MLILATETSLLDLQDPKLEMIFIVNTKLLACTEYKHALLTEMALTAASEDGRFMEHGTLIGQLIAISMIARDDMTDINIVRQKIEGKIKACKTQGAYNKTLSVYPFH